MEICCGDELIAKAEFECCAGTARALTPNKRCCNKRDGADDYDPSKGEKCCRGSDGLGKNDSFCALGKEARKWTSKGVSYLKVILSL